MNLFRLYRDPLPESGGGTATVTPAAPSAAAPASASARMPLPPAGSGQPPAAAEPPAFSVPDAYKEKPWAKSLDSQDKVWTMLDGAQELIGKRPAGIPAPDAPQAEWDKFYEAAGRPKTAAEYQFDYGKDKDGKPLAASDVKWEAGVKEMMFKHGITAKQAVGLQKDFDQMVAGVIKEKNLAVEADNKAFTDVATELFGAQRDRILAEGKELLAKHVTDPRIQAHMNKLDNNALMVLASVLKGVRETYIKPGAAPGTPPGSPGTGVAGGGKEAMQSEARRLMTSEAYTQPMHPEHDATVKRINQIYIDIGKMS